MRCKKSPTHTRYAEQRGECKDAKRGARRRGAYHEYTFESALAKVFPMPAGLPLSLPPAVCYDTARGR